MLLLLTACSNTNLANGSHLKQQTPDTYENINRKVFAFNKGIDKVFLRPVAKVYKKVTPKFVDQRIGNFFSNLGDVKNAVNNTFQGKFGDAVNDSGRFFFNSTLGLAGFIDIASAAGMEKHDEDFGQTLATWGVKSGPYVMLPFLGPSTLRDAVAQISVDRFTDPALYSNANVEIFIVEAVKKRSDLFTQEEIAKGLSNDQYSALRDVWLQNRQFLIRDGKSDESAESDLIDELESLDL